MMFGPSCMAEENATIPSLTSIESASPSKIPVIETAPNLNLDSKKDFHLEVSGNYSWLNNDYGIWKALDVKLMYSGFQRITPFGSVSVQSRKEGSQMVYGVGSYINIHRKFYMIAGMSGAPVHDPNVILYPRLRMDLSGFYKMSAIDGLIISTGISYFPKQNGNGAETISIGGMYYIGKAIFTGSLNYNIAHPGNVTSLSGQAGVMYGTEGRYWLGGGVAVGRVAYQLASTIPFDVRYESRSFNIFYKKWIGKNWGLNGRYDYQDLRRAYKLNGITVSMFVDF
jgi:YaiO family outer membrane protein